MKKLALILTLIVLMMGLFSNSIAKEDCIFDDSAFEYFKQDYLNTHANARFDSATEQLLINKGQQQIQVTGGGCNHLGVTINVQNIQNLSEQELFDFVVLYSSEFAHWLINIDSLKQAIHEKNWQKTEDAFFVYIDEMTVFEVIWTKQNILISIYIN